MQLWARHYCETNPFQLPSCGRVIEPLFMCLLVNWLKVLRHFQWWSLLVSSICQVVWCSFICWWLTWHSLITLGNWLNLQPVFLILALGVPLFSSSCLAYNSLYGAMLCTVKELLQEWSHIVCAHVYTCMYMLVLFYISFFRNNIP